MNPVRTLQQVFWRGKAMKMVVIILKTINTNLEF